MLLTSLLTTILLGATEPKVSAECNFGEVYEFGVGNCDAMLPNTTNATLKLRIKPMSAGDSVASENISIPPNRTALVSLSIKADSHPGAAIHYFLLQSANGKTDGRQAYIQANGFVMSALDESHPRVEFGGVSVSDKARKKLVLSSHESLHFQIKKIIDKPAQVDAAILPDGQSIEVSIRPDAAWGFMSDSIKLSIDSPRQKEAWISVSGEIHGNVFPSRNPASLGIVSANVEQELPITELRSKDGVPFDIGRIRADGLSGVVKVGDCVEFSPACKSLHLVVGKNQKEGLMRGKVLVELPQHGKNISIDVQALFMAKAELDTNPGVRSVPTSGEADSTSSLAAANAAQGAGIAPRKADGLDLAASETLASDPSPPGTGPLLKWDIQDERTVYGYQIYRADSQSGPFLMRTSPAIRAKSSSKDGSKYQWRDESAKGGESYWYYIGVIYNDGMKQQLTGPQKALAK